MDYGVTPNGFVRKRLDVIEAEIKQSLKQKLIEQGYTGDLAGGVDSVFGLTVKTFAEREAAIWERMHGVYTAMYPSMAEGVALDNAASFTGVSRLPAEGAVGEVTFYGVNGAEIPSLTEVKNTASNVIWQTSETAKISFDALNELTLTLPQELKPETEYGFTLNGEKISFITPEIPVTQEIMRAIFPQIDKGVFLVEEDERTFSISRIDRAKFSVTGIQEFIANGLGAHVPVRALSDEKDFAQAGQINELNRPIEGIERVVNQSATTPAKEVETDADLRKRYETGVYRTGAATLPSLQPNMMSQVSNIVACRVFQNDSDVVDDAGRKPHSVHYVVYGGTDTDVAREILTRKGAGIDTNGAVTVELKEEHGEYKIHFDRPSLRYVWLRLKIYMKQEKTPILESEIKRDVIERSQNYSIGDSAPSSNLVCSLYKNKNIKNIEVEFAITETEASEPTVWKSGLIEARETDLLMFAQSRITVEVVDA